MKTSPLRQVLGAALLAAMSTFAAAQAYPSRPITVVVPFAAGGPTDTIARILGERMGRSLGQPLVIENTAGAGGPIAAHRRAPQAFTAGQVDMPFDQGATALPQVRAGKIKAYAVPSKNRLTSQPDIPTVDEAGLPGFYMSVWHAFWAPKGTPKEVVNRLNAAPVETIADPGVPERLPG